MRSGFRSLVFTTAVLIGIPHASSQQVLEVDDIVEELAQAAAFVQARATLADSPTIDVPNGGTLTIAQPIFSAEEIKIGSGGKLLLDPGGEDTKDFFIVTKKLTLPSSSDLAVIGWMRPSRPAPPPTQERAPSGTDGRGAGQNGLPGKAGQNGEPGIGGAPAPHLTIIVLEMNGNGLQIDLRGGDGGRGGVGQAGGNGGHGARGNSAKTAWVEFLGAKTHAGCAAGPGRGGNGGDAGVGGQGGIGGNGGPGGDFRIVASKELGDKFFDTSMIDVSSGAPGLGGAGGEAGQPGRAGPEGKLASQCDSAGRVGKPGKPAPDSNGSNGPPGKVSADGSVSRVNLSMLRLSKAFGFGSQ